MAKSDFINEFVDQASRLFPKPGSREELQKGMQVIAQAALAKLELVPRAEFDAQKAVLSATRAKVDSLEQQVKELSAILDADT